MNNPLHYPDIERCKKLTEIGFPKTANEWRIRAGSFKDCEYILQPFQMDTDEIKLAYYVCPSVMEMLDVIPNDLGTGKLNDVLKIQNSFNDWSVSMGKSFHTEGTLPNALADLIFWLVENKYITF